MYIITFKNGERLILPTNLSQNDIQSIINLIGVNEGNKFLTLSTESEGIICGFIPNEIISIVKVNPNKEES